MENPSEGASQILNHNKNYYINLLVLLIEYTMYQSALKESIQ